MYKIKKIIRNRKIILDGGSIGLWHSRKSAGGVAVSPLFEKITPTPELSLRPSPSREGWTRGYLRGVEGEGFGASEALSRIWRHSVSRRSNWAWEICWAGMGDPLFGSAATGSVKGTKRRAGRGNAVEKSGWDDQRLSSVLSDVFRAEEPLRRICCHAFSKRSRMCWGTVARVASACIFVSAFMRSSSMKGQCHTAAFNFHIPKVK